MEVGYTARTTIPANGRSNQVFRNSSEREDFMVRWYEYTWGDFLSASLLGISLRVSYHVYHQVQFLHLQQSYENNRVSEELNDADLREARRTICLQRIFLAIYGWQDRIIARIDVWSRRNEAVSGTTAACWYGNPIALRLSGLIGLGTELFLLMVCSVGGDLRLYMWLNIVGMNMILLMCVFYRRAILRRRCGFTPS
jgi:hypothetical protein